MAFFVLLRRRRSITLPQQRVCPRRLLLLLGTLERAKKTRATTPLHQPVRSQRQGGRIVSSHPVRRDARVVWAFCERERERERERDHCFIPLQTKEEVENRGIFYQKPPFKNEEKREKKGRTDANNAAVVAAVTAALESFSDKLDAWTVLLTELCRKEKRERLVSARRRGLFAERHYHGPKNKKRTKY